LIRKTGLGIKSCIDYSGSYISQTVYSCNYKTANDVDIEYYLGVLNSRVLLYYYLKLYGENEWKSHPYITKEIIFNLPIRKVSNDNKNLCKQISDYVKIINNNYSISIDMEIEKLAMQLYRLDENEEDEIRNEINSLPNLESINGMKF